MDDTGTGTSSCIASLKGNNLGSLIPRFTSYTPKLVTVPGLSRLSATMQQADLERIAQQLTMRKGQLRQGILMTKRSLGEAVQDIADSVREMQACRERLLWLETMLANLKDAIAVAKTLDEKEDFEDEVEEWEDEREEEMEHMQFLAREHNQMQEHRKMLLASLVTLGRQFLQVRHRERVLVSAALRLGVVRLHRIKQVV